MTKFSQKDSSADLSMEDSRYEQPGVGPVPGNRDLPRATFTDADIERMIAEFDFEKVHQAMTALRWDWHDSQSVPSVAEMKTRIRQLAKSVREQGWGSVRTGGFGVSLESTPVAHYLSMDFTVEAVTVELFPAVQSEGGHGTQPSPSSVDEKVETKK